ncbi:MAG: PorT family protein [Cytophagales bacterium]|nr:PorT family protein [Cytophagales bacterium]
MKILLSILTLGIFSSGALGQFSVGLHGGSNLSQMDFSNNPEYKFTEINYSQGFIGGVVVQFLGEKHAGVQLEINYSQRGWIERDTVDVNNLKIRNKMDYLEIPVLTHINIGGGNFRGLFNLGPYLGYALNRSITVTDENTGNSSTAQYNFNNDKDNRIDFGLLVGGGFEYRLRRGKLSAEARYTIGLGDINKDKVVQSELSQFRIIAVLLRYTYQLGEKN